MQIINTLLLIGAGAASLASAATTSHYFEVSELYSNQPSGINAPALDSITFPVEDSKTKTSATCTVSWNWSGKAPTTYTTCTDNTYGVKITDYKDITDFTINLKHQYNNKGKKCVNTNAKTCVTTLGSYKVTKSDAGFSSYCGSSGACGAVASKALKFAVSSSKTGTQ